MDFIDEHREELANEINAKIQRMEYLANVWKYYKSDESVWFEACKLMGEVAPLVEEFRQGVELETGQIFLN